MKISEVVEKTQVSKQAIHHYINEGYLHRPLKKGKVSAEYDDGHVSQLRLIKELRDNYFLPLTVIKEVIKEQENRPAPDRVLFDFKAKHFRPLEWLLEETVIGKEAYLKATGIGIDWLERMEQRGIISPEYDGDEPVYSADDVFMGKLIADLNESGMGPRDGLDPAALLDVARHFQAAIETAQERFIKPITEGMPAEERASKSRTMADLMGLFFYHMNRKRCCYSEK